MSLTLPYLTHEYHVDMAILHEQKRVVCIRFGRPTTASCIAQDDVLASTAHLLQNLLVIYLVDIDTVTGFNSMYELYDDMSLMFFHRNRHIMVDQGTGDNNKITTVIDDATEFVDLAELIYRGANRGDGLIIANRNRSTSWAY